MVKRLMYEELEERVAALEKENRQLRKEANQIKEKLGRGEEKYRIVADFTYDWEMWISPSGYYLYVSPSCERITGYLAEEFITDSSLFRHILHPDDLARVEKHHRDETEGSGQIHSIDFRIINRRGEERWINHYCQPVYGHDMCFLGRRVSNRDITERKQLEDELKQSEERFRAIFENSMDAIFFTAPDGRVFSANRAACEMTGYTENEIIELGRESVIDPTDPRLPGALEERRSKGRFRGELNLRRKDGSGFPAELSSAIFKDNEGGERSSMIIRDITGRRRCEEALQASEKRYRIVSELTSDFAGSYRVEPDGNIVSEWVWGAAKDITGFTAEEIDARGGWKSLVHPDDVDIALRHLETLFSGSPDTCELRIVTRKGAVRWLHNQARPKRDSASGRVVLIYGASKDITERKQAEEALRESEQRYRDLVKYAPAGICEVAIPEMRVTAVNDVLCEYSGYTREDLLSMDLLDFVTEESRGPVLERWQRILSGEEVPDQMEVKAKKKDGRESWILFISSITYEGGRPRRAVVIVHDITERKRAEDAFRESEERYRSLFENMLDGFAYCKMIFDDQERPVDFVYLNVNSAFEQLTGLENVVGKKATKVIPGIKESSPELFEIYARVALTGKPERLEIDFKPLELWLSISVYSTRKGYFVAVFDNITGRRRAEKELQKTRERLFQAQKMESLGVLVAGLSHEINNPVNTIMMNAPLLRRVWEDLLPNLQEYAERDPCRKYGGLTSDFLVENMGRLISDVDRAGNRISKIIQGLKDFARKTGPGEAGLVSLDACVASALDLVKTTARKSGISLSFQAGKDLPAIKGDPVHVEQIILNLLLNAVQASTHEHGKISVITGRQKRRRRVFVSVEDNGSGIDPGTHNKVFDPFFTTRQTEGGTGLGLAVTYSLVKAHAGEISYKSLKGRGTTFTVTFPIA